MTIIKLYKKDGDREDEETLILDEEGNAQPAPEPSWAQKLWGHFVTFSIVRFIILMVAFVCFLWGLFSAFFTVAAGTLTMFTGGQVSTFSELFRKHWRNLKFAVVCLAGLCVAVFSPALGMTLIASYCMMRAHDPRSTFFLRFLESRLEEFNMDLNR